MAEEIKVFTAEQLDEASHLYVSVFNAEPWNDLWTFETARKRLSDILQTPGFIGFVCLEHELLGFAVGYCEQWFDNTHFYLKEMCVRTGMQRKGIGTRLIDHLERALAEMNVDRVYLLTMKDGQAEAFYAKNGYRTSPRMILMSHRLR